MREFPLLPIFCNTCYCQLPYVSQSEICVMQPHCDLYLHFSLTNEAKDFLVLFTDHVNFLICEFLIQVFPHFLLYFTSFLLLYGVL